MTRTTATILAAAFAALSIGAARAEDDAALIRQLHNPQTLERVGSPAPAPREVTYAQGGGAIQIDLAVRDGGR